MIGEKQSRTRIHSGAGERGGVWGAISGPPIFR